ncbi:MAG: LysM peptidoglycan-binding domain-containing protein [Nitrospirae bacterium]|nr:LysM peptidoglycan-binding domain-containing protein [Nitrospirota bacterium]
MAKPSAVTWVDGIFWVADYNLNRVFKVTSTFSVSSDKTVYTSDITTDVQEVKPEVKEVKQEEPVRESTGKVEIQSVPELTLVPNPAADYFEYIVKDNDTLWDIVSKKFGASPMDWPKVWELNPDIKNPDMIYPGQHIRIPGYLKEQQKASKEASVPVK